MGMAFDAAMNTMLLFGGSSPAGLLNDTWGFTGAAWVKLISPGCTAVCPSSPPARSLTNMVYDGAMRTLILLGGNGSASGIDYRNDTWSLPCSRMCGDRSHDADFWWRSP